MRDLANNFAAGIIETAQAFDLREFRKQILEDKLKLSPVANTQSVREPG